eukprot:Hpha_TRINITY_DN15851_c6_g1::TRINITY_DN15851_c6_g1_i2::g.191509::m.191509
MGCGASRVQTLKDSPGFQGVERADTDGTATECDFQSFRMDASTSYLKRPRAVDLPRAHPSDEVLPRDDGESERPLALDLPRTLSSEEAPRDDGESERSQAHGSLHFSEGIDPSIGVTDTSYRSCLSSHAPNTVQSEDVAALQDRLAQTESECKALRSMVEELRSQVGKAMSRPRLVLKHKSTTERFTFPAQQMMDQSERQRRMDEDELRRSLKSSRSGQFEWNHHSPKRSDEDELRTSLRSSSRRSDSRRSDRQTDEDKLRISIKSGGASHDLSRLKNRGRAGHPRRSGNTVRSNRLGHKGNHLLSPSEKEGSEMSEYSNLEELEMLETFSLACTSPRTSEECTPKGEFAPPKPPGLRPVEQHDY